MILKHLIQNSQKLCIYANIIVDLGLTPGSTTKCSKTDKKILIENFPQNMFAKCNEFPIFYKFQTGLSCRFHLQRDAEKKQVLMVVDIIRNRILALKYMDIFTTI